MSELQAFFHMGGYAWYVWASYTIAFVVLLANIILTHRHLRERRQQAQRRVHRSKSSA